MLDTNVLVSAFIFKGQIIAKLIDLLIDNHSITLPSYVLNELKEVIKEKFPARCADLDLFLTSLPFEYVYTPDILDNAKYPSLRDDDDLPVLASAIMADVDILLTGDKDFAGLKLEHPKILTPAQFIEQCGAGF
jgi:putative PIN family toxin of toxin-antitoxin system